jgi:hypothetical protein
MMGVPAREDAMDAMVPNDTRAAANVEQTPWDVTLLDVDRSNTRETSESTHQVASFRPITFQDSG